MCSCDATSAAASEHQVGDPDSEEVVGAGTSQVKALVRRPRGHEHREHPPDQLHRSPRGNRVADRGPANHARTVSAFAAAGRRQQGRRPITIETLVCGATLDPGAGA
jgi:hypothetical protein